MNKKYNKKYEKKYNFVLYVWIDANFGPQNFGLEPTNKPPHWMVVATLPTLELALNRQDIIEQRYDVKTVIKSTLKSKVDLLDPR